MKIKINVPAGQTLADAEEFLEKAVNLKKECSESERYDDKPLNDFHDFICKRNSDLLDSLFSDIEEEIKHAVK